MNSPDSGQRGHASGWQIFPSQWEDVGWRWSAFGPAGGTMGTAKSEAEATERAIRAMEDLKRHTLPPSSRER